MTYELLFTRDAAEQIEALPPRKRTMIDRALDRLAAGDRKGVRKLKGRKKSDPVWRRTVHDYRVLFSYGPNKGELTIRVLAPRKKVYKGKKGN